MIINLKFSDQSEIELTELQFDEIKILIKKRAYSNKNRIKSADHFYIRIINDLRIKSMTQSSLINKYRRHKNEVIDAICKLESDGVIKINDSTHKYSKVNVRTISLI